MSLYNTGVRTCEFSGVIALFADDGALDFEGVPGRGAFTGKAAIAQHFIDDPPEDEIFVTRWKHAGDSIIAEFRWTDIPEGGGCLFVQRREGSIARLTIVLGGPRRAFVPGV